MPGSAIGIADYRPQLKRGRTLAGAHPHPGDGRVGLRGYGGDPPACGPPVAHVCRYLQSAEVTRLATPPT